MATIAPKAPPVFMCIYNPATRVIDHAVEITPEKAAEDWPYWQLECMNRGAPWTPYKGDKPFAWPVEPVAEVPLA